MPEKHCCFLHLQNMRHGKNTRRKFFSRSPTAADYFPRKKDRTHDSMPRQRIFISGHFAFHPLQHFTSRPITAMVRTFLCHPLLAKCCRICLSKSYSPESVGPTLLSFLACAGLAHHPGELESLTPDVRYACTHPPFPGMLITFPSTMIPAKRCYYLRLRNMKHGKITRKNTFSHFLLLPIIFPEMGRKSPLQPSFLALYCPISRGNALPSICCGPSLSGVSSLRFPVICAFFSTRSSVSSARPKSYFPAHVLPTLVSFPQCLTDNPVFLSA